MEAQTRRMTTEMDEDEQVANALKTGDIETAMRLDPQTTEMFLRAQQFQKQQRTEQAMTGLGDIPISRQKIDMAPLQKQENWAYEQMRDQRNENRRYGLDLQREQRYAAAAAPRAATGGPSLGLDPDSGAVVDLNKTSEGERVSAGYLGRMRNAESTLRNPGYADYAPGTPAFMAFASLLDDDTGVMGATVANGVLTEADRAYMGQALDFILAKMRKESGATIKGGEFRKEYINYFPLPGDSAEEKGRKARKRELAMKQLEISAGRAAPLAEQMNADAPAAPSSFASEAEAEAAAAAGQIKKGDRITIGGVSGTWQ